MKALIRHDVVCDRHLVYFYDRDTVTGARMAYTLDHMVHDCPPGAEMPVALELTSQQFAALVDELHPAAEPPGADAVADARATRDRLLTMVEQTVANGFGS